MFYKVEYVMNERIKELMAEAGIDVEKLRTYSGGWPREDLIILQDFAKLIVIECAKAADEGMSQVTMKVEWPSYHIKKHFGVEE